MKVDAKVRKAAVNRAVNRTVRGRYRSRMMWNIFLSGVIAYGGIILLMLFWYAVMNVMSGAGYDVSALAISEKTIYLYVGVMTLIGLTFFALSFASFQKKNLRYLEQIALEAEEISRGNLDREIPLEGTDELTILAERLNSMSADVRNLMDREREAERSKNELVTNVAHDLRTPLTSIRGYLDLLVHQKNLDEETKERYAQIAFDKTKRLQDLIEELFDFTKMSYGKISVKPGPLDLMKLLEQLSDEFYPLFDRAGLTFEFESNVDSIPMIGDGMLLARLFANLLNNAVKYGAEGKMIRLIVEAKPPLVSVRVINYGEVIPADRLDRLFDKFYRVENSRSESTGGTGLGLPIAKNITRLHGGTIHVTSDMDGTCFEVCLNTEHDFSKEDLTGLE